MEKWKKFNHNIIMTSQNSTCALFRTDWISYECCKKIPEKLLRHSFVLSFSDFNIFTAILLSSVVVFRFQLLAPFCSTVVMLSSQWKFFWMKHFLLAFPLFLIFFVIIIEMCRLCRRQMKESFLAHFFYVIDFFSQLDYGIKLTKTLREPFIFLNLYKNFIANERSLWIVQIMNLKFSLAPYSSPSYYSSSPRFSFPGRNENCLPLEVEKIETFPISCFKVP